MPHNPHQTETNKEQTPISQRQYNNNNFTKSMKIETPSTKYKSTNPNSPTQKIKTQSYYTQTHPQENLLQVPQGSNNNQSF